MESQDKTIETRATGSYDMRDSLTGVRGYYTLLNDVDDYSGDGVFVVLCDVDNFRPINDAYGENVGNTLLAQIGQTIKLVFGDTHTFRYGSDEFLIVNKFFDEYAFLEKIDALERRLRKIDYEGKPLDITCSYGYTYGTISDVEDMHEAIRFADRKMYEAKRMGKARSVGSPLAVDPRLASKHHHATMYKSYEVDELTDLANLICFHNVLSTELAKGVATGYEEGACPTVVYFNIENFKAYNQRFGFDAGDSLLLLIADAIRDAYSGKHAARLSADQFAVFTTEDKVIEGIESVRTEFRKKQKNSSIWLKAGYYCVEPEDESGAAICDRAKLACDAIKGRRDVYYYKYDDELKKQILWHRYVLEHFAEAIKKGWIQAYYQPIVRVATGEICDLEVLARWIDPMQGMVSPADFIPVLEESRLVHQLDLEILRCVCRDMRKRMENGEKVIPPSINLSRLDFELCDIVDEVEKILDEYDIDRSLVAIEVTESALSGSVEFLKNEVDRFRADGFEVWMDDFGSGYSSLNVLKEYNFDLVKIDMAFLRGFEDNESARVMLAHVIDLAKELGLRTLCEGVETKEQFEFLRSVGLGRAQGYYFSKPRAYDDFVACVADKTLPPIELLGKRDFYEKIGKINLMRPNALKAPDGSYLPSDYAVAILRRREGVYSYLNATTLFDKFLNDIGIGTREESEAEINSPDGVRKFNFVATIEACEHSDGWQSYVASYDGYSRPVHMKRIDVIEEFDALAVLCIIEESYQFD